MTGRITRKIGCIHQNWLKTGVILKRADGPIMILPVPSGNSSIKTGSMEYGVCKGRLERIQSVFQYFTFHQVVPYGFTFPFPSNIATGMLFVKLSKFFHIGRPITWWGCRPKLVIGL